MNQTDTLTDLMARLGILPAGQITEATRLEGLAPNPRAFLTDLVRRGWLTPLQAVQIGRNRGHHLVVGRYVLLERLGAGGMGRVFLARDPRLDRVVALKLVRLDRRHCSTIRTRFRREFLFAARLNHENVVHSHDAGIDHRALYLVMEFVPGLDLARVIASEGPLAVGRACEYARQALLGLQHIHDQGMIHRDVKPSNLGLARGGRTVKILDVGLARVQRKGDAPSRKRRRRKLLGSPDYVAPEQVVDSRRVDPRADQYALGCTLYHMLAGHVPFPGGTASEKAKRHLTKVARSIEELQPDLPAGLGDVLRRLMNLRRSARFATAAEAAAALAPYAVAFGDSVSSVQKADSTISLPTTADLPTLSERSDQGSLQDSSSLPTRTAHARES